MSFTRADERVPPQASPPERVVHWCDVVIRLTELNDDLYLNGDLTVRFALYHAMGLIGDSAKAISEQDTEAMPSVNWTALFSMRTFLVHRPHLVDSDKVWQAATESVPALLSTLIAYQTRIGQSSTR